MSNIQEIKLVKLVDSEDTWCGLLNGDKFYPFGQESTNDYEDGLVLAKETLEDFISGKAKLRHFGGWDISFDKPKSIEVLYV
ncbi:hypothetical protein Pm5460_28 [Proteus phage vB_PmiP_Pm5460]|uniref:Uncharacterized protein n=1 Tax=Proteus phage vB_PmiP_Pm5460 TaxID=1636249 RepID=A0A0G2SS05_9CAUD|nr:hypothetical protein AVT60_gp29 [Proteus phage vB_PmiP_Pm5460]AKA61838.1 hypothetical protein Pm5460_28 [Proteus phage vB_PmiP_Pm5460]